MTGIPMEHGLALAAAEAAVGLALMIQLFQRLRTLNLDLANRMRG